MRPESGSGLAPGAWLESVSCVPPCCRFSPPRRRVRSSCSSRIVIDSCQSWAGAGRGLARADSPFPLPATHLVLSHRVHTRKAHAVAGSELVCGHKLRALDLEDERVLRRDPHVGNVAGLARPPVRQVLRRIAALVGSHVRPEAAANEGKPLQRIARPHLAAGRGGRGREGVTLTRSPPPTAHCPRPYQNVCHFLGLLPLSSRWWSARPRRKCDTPPERRCASAKGRVPGGNGSGGDCVRAGQGLSVGRLCPPAYTALPVVRGEDETVHGLGNAGNVVALHLYPPLGAAALLPAQVGRVEVLEHHPFLPTQSRRVQRCQHVLRRGRRRARVGR